MKRITWQIGFWLALAVCNATATPAPSRPQFDWSTYLGGGTDDYINDLIRDSAGNLIVVGETFSPNWIVGGFDTVYAGSRDAFVAKYDPTGTTLLWSSYLGSGSDDTGSGVATDSLGNVFVIGSTRSRYWTANTNFVGTNAMISTNYHDNGLQDAFVAKLDPNGNHVWSAFLGGNDWDSGWAITADSEGNAIAVGETKSGQWVSKGSKTNYLGGTDAFVVKLAGQTGSNIWSTYLGGSSADAAWGVTTDGSTNIFVTGYTRSGGWAKGTPGNKYFGTNINGGSDAFLAKFNSAGSNVWATYMGGNQDDNGHRVAVDATGNIVVSGDTLSSGWVTNGYDTIYNGGRDAFVAMFNGNGAHQWSTYLGGRYDEYGTGVALDSAANVFVTGWTRSAGWVNGGFDTTFNVIDNLYSNSTVVAGFDKIYTNNSEGFVVKLNSLGQPQWSSYLGGVQQDAGTGLVLDGAGAIFVAGWTTSSNWATGGFDTTHNGGVDGFIARLHEVAPTCVSNLPAPATICVYSNNSFTPTLSWMPVTDAVGYVVRISATNCAAAPFYVSPALDSNAVSFSVPAYAGLLDRQFCFWQVKALGDGVTVCDSAWSSCCQFTNNVTDRGGPSISFDGTVPNTVYTNPITIRGRASDGSGVASVLYQLTYGLVQTNLWQEAITTNSWTNWWISAPLAFATNSVRVIAIDKIGNVSQQMNVNINYHVTNLLTLITNTIPFYSNTQNRITRNNFPPNTNGLILGVSYRVTAEPANGWLFSNWVGSITSTNRTLDFIMQPGMILQANFVTNPFIAMKGNYNGLFYPSDVPVMGSNSGAFSLSLSDKGTYSGRLLLAGMSLGFSGGFPPSGEMVTNIVIAQPGRELLPIDMKLNALFGQGMVTGQISTLDFWTRQTSWVAQAVAFVATTTNNHPLAGKYTLVSDGSPDPTNAPAGHTAAAVTINANGSVSVSGSMADGSGLNQGTALGANGWWPLYQSLNSGRGVFLGWMSPNTNAPALWGKLPVRNDRYYSNGFSLLSTTLVARYVSPAAGQNAVKWTNGLAIIGGGNLESATNQIQISNNVVRVLGGSISNLTLTLSTANGTFSGSFRHPVSRQTANVRGSLVQDPAQSLPSGGWFLGTNQSGFIRLVPQP